MHGSEEFFQPHSSVDIDQGDRVRIWADQLTERFRPLHSESDSHVTIVVQVVPPDFAMLRLPVPKLVKSPRQLEKKFRDEIYNLSRSEDVRLQRD